MALHADFQLENHSRCHDILTVRVGSSYGLNHFNSWFEQPTKIWPIAF